MKTHVSQVEIAYQANREARAMISELIEIASQLPFSPKAIADFRREMARKLSRHIGERDRVIVTPLRQSDDPADRELTQRYTDEMLSMRRRVSELNNRWSIRAIEDNPREYRLALRTHARRMVEQFAWEETILFPAASRRLERTGGRAHEAA